MSNIKRKSSATEINKAPRPSPNILIEYSISWCFQVTNSIPRMNPSEQAEFWLILLGNKNLFQTLGGFKTVSSRPLNVKSFIKTRLWWWPDAFCLQLANRKRWSSTLMNQGLFVYIHVPSRTFMGPDIFTLILQPRCFPWKIRMAGGRGNKIWWSVQQHGRGSSV